MTRHGLLWLLLASLAWHQGTNSRSALEAQTTPTVKTAARDLGHRSEISNTAQDKPLITISGLCDNPSADKSAASKCETVITRAQFEKVISAIQPDMRAHARREFALHYADVLVMSKKAEQMGLDKKPNFEEQMRLARIQVLSRELEKVIQEQTSQISEKDIEDYYSNNMTRFEKAKIDRIYVPKIQQSLPISDKELRDSETSMRSRKSEETMKAEADNLRARAIAGEGFTKLQADAYEIAGLKTAAPPNTIMVIRRISLPPNQVSVMDLKPGEVSEVLTDTNGYAIYKVETKDKLSLDQAREEIKATLRSLHKQDAMRNIEDSTNTTLDESYFVRSRSQ
jgi:PPIC-type PPIASE domain